jgi:peptide subunit release factor 1 (eRF1)
MVLSIKETIQKLKNYNDRSFPILSVYLEIKKDNPNEQLMLLRSFHKLIDTTLSRKKQTQLRQSLIYMDSYLNNFYDIHNYHGIALFAGGNKLWEVITTPFSLPTSLHVDHSPFLTPIKQKLHEYDRYLVVLADRQKAKFFTLHLGNIEEQIDFRDKKVPQEVNTGVQNSRGNKLDRHIKEHLHKHFNDVANKLNKFVGNKPIDGVVLGSHKTLIPTLEDHLPKKLQNKIIGNFLAEPDTNINELIIKCKHVVELNQKIAE